MSGLRCLRTVVVVAALTVAVSGSAHGGHCERPSGQSIQFGIIGDFRLGTFEGTTISYQRFLSERVAWRVGVSIDVDYSAVDYSETSIGDLEEEGDTDLTQWNNSFSAVSEWLVYRGAPVSVYFGGGPRISYTTRQSESVWFYPDDEGSWRASGRQEKSLGLGLSGVIGVQWAAADWVALHAEYRLDAMYRHETSDRWNAEGGSHEYLTEHCTVADRFVLDSKSVRFGLSVYF